MDYIIKKIENVSAQFETIIDLLEYDVFRIKFLARLVHFKGDISVDLPLLEKIYPYNHHIVEDSKITSLSLEEMQREFKVCLEDSNLSAIRTVDSNTRIEKIFWKTISKFVNVENSTCYTTDVAWGNTQWDVFWIIVDSNNGRVLLLHGYAYD